MDVTNYIVLILVSKTALQMIYIYMYEGDLHKLISIFHFYFRDQFLFSIISCSCYVIG